MDTNVCLKIDMGICQSTVAKGPPPAADAAWALILVTGLKAVQPHGWEELLVRGIGSLERGHPALSGHCVPGAAPVEQLLPLSSFGQTLDRPGGQGDCPSLAALTTCSFPSSLLSPLPEPASIPVPFQRPTPSPSPVRQ